MPRGSTQTLALKMNNLDPITLWDGAKLAYTNGQSLLDGAQDAANRSNYGLACSLAILSAEESTKAFAMIIGCFAMTQEAPKLRKFFSDHKHKHDAGAGYLTIAEIGKLLLREMSMVGNDPSIPLNEKARHLQAKQQTMLAAGVPGIRHELDNVQSWSKEANNLKNNGLYVNYTGTTWSSPNDVSAQTYEIQFAMATALRKIGAGILHHQSYEEAENAFNKFRNSYYEYRDTQVES